MTAAAKKSTVKADIGKNRLIFTIAGWLTKKDLDNLYTDVRFCVADLKPGFQVITDLSACTLGSLAGIATFRKIMNYLLEKEAGQVVRITRHASLIHRQILNFSARMQGYKPVYVQTLEEAEQVLANGTGRSELTFHLPRTAVHLLAGTVHATGYIRDISPNGCSFEGADFEVEAGQSLTLELELPGQNNSSQRFEIPARIVALEQDHAVAEFIDLARDQRNTLRACLIRAARTAP